MTLTYRVERTDEGWLACCLESNAEGEGTTKADAVVALRASLEERLFRPDAVAPPAESPHASIDLVEVH